MSRSAMLSQVGLAVKRLQWRHHRNANSALASIGLSLAQWDVLRHLHENPSASLHKLAVLTFQTDQSMGALATRMIGRGYLERVEGPGRAVRHRLTQSGEQLRTAGASILDVVLSDTLGRLSTSELTQMASLLARANESEDQEQRAL